MLNESPHSERFHELLSQVKSEVDILKDDLKKLEKENKRLKIELKQAEDSNEDVFSAMEETERMAMKHQIQGLISKIDDHLKDGA